MRKVWIAALAVAAAMAVAGVAIAANEYKVHVAKSSAKGKGSLANPSPTSIALGFRVTESDPSKRAAVVEKYGLGAEGILAKTKVAPKCRFSQIVRQTGPPAKCDKALVGRGLVKNAAGASNDERLSESLPCNLRIRLYNIGDGMAIRLDGFGRRPPPSFGSDVIGCPLPIATAIRAKFVTTKIAGVKSSDLRFRVPQNLKHPVTGTDNSIREATNKIFLKKKEINGKEWGFYNEVGCKGRTRTTRATFVTEATATSPARKFTAFKEGRC